MRKDYVISPRVTLQRLRWLTKLEAEWPCQRAFTRVGYDCMQLGWTEWNYKDRQEGDNLTLVEAQRRFGHKYWDFTHIDGERLTDEGRRVLKEAEEKAGKLTPEDPLENL